MAILTDRRVTARNMILILGIAWIFTGILLIPSVEAGSIKQSPIKPSRGYSGNNSLTSPGSLGLKPSLSTPSPIIPSPVDPEEPSGPSTPPRSGSGQGTWGNFGQVASVTVCVAGQNSIDNCLGVSLEEAAEDLSRHIISKYLKKEITHSFTVDFPLAVELHDQQEVLLEIDRMAINHVAAFLKREARSLSSYKWETEEDRRAKLAVIQDMNLQYKREGRSAAGTSSHFVQTGLSSHVFKCGSACHQLKQVHANGFGRN